LTKTEKQVKKRISVIVPVYNESSGLDLFYRTLISLFEDRDCYAWEILLVDDGSSDDSWSEITRLSSIDPRISGIALSRNFGKELALTAGVEYICSSADAVIFIDADLQHPPQVIPQFISAWEDGAEVVVGIRKEVEDYSFIKKMGSRLFYVLMTRYSEINIPPNSTDFRLLDKKVVQALCTFSERTRMFRGLIDWMGFKKVFLEFSAPDRKNGNPTYSIKKLFKLALNSFTSFSLLPLRLTGIFGVLVCTLTLPLLVYMGISQMLNLQFFTPLAYFVVFNTLLVGITLSATGMLALYIGHIHTEVVGRPLYIIREITTQKKAKCTHECGCNEG
jgi:dolichol-phosphate mannosyltransferase